MRVLQVMGTLDRGGVESMIVNLVRNGFKTDICLEIPDKGAMEEELKKYRCQIYHLTRRSTSMAKHHRELAEIARNYDIVHIHAQNAFLAYIEVLTVKKSGVRKVIVHSHNTKDWRTGLLGTICHMAARPFLRRSCIMAACSTEAAKWMFGSANTHIIPLPIDTGRFRYDAETGRKQREDLGIGPDKRVLLHIGNFRKAKNHMFLIQLMEKLEKIYPGTYMLLLAGDGPLRKELEIKAEGLQIKFLGSIDNVPEIMAASEVFLLPSLNEGLPTVALEAQAAGLPCLLSDNITKECRITDLVKFLPLSLDSWVETIPDSVTAGAYEPELYAGIVNKTNGIQTVLDSFQNLYAGENK